MVQVGRAVAGAIFLVLFAGFELHIPAIENLIPGSYAGLAYTGYIGFGFLITGITSLAAAFSGPSKSDYRMAMQARGPSSSMPDTATMAAMMVAMQPAQQMQPPGSAVASIRCPSCGKPNQTGAKFCQQCAAPLPV